MVTAHQSYVTFAGQYQGGSSILQADSHILTSSLRFLDQFCDLWSRVPKNLKDFLKRFGLKLFALLPRGQSSRLTVIY
jgi:hypothetical protein